MARRVDRSCRAADVKLSERLFDRARQHYLLLDWLRSLDAALPPERDGMGVVGAAEDDLEDGAGGFEAAARAYCRTRRDRAAAVLNLLGQG